MLQFLKSVWTLSVAAVLAAAFPAAATSAPVAHDVATSTYGQLPLTFETNSGQAPPDVRFLSRGRGYSFFVTPAEASLRLHDAGGGDAVVSWQTMGGQRNPRILGESPVDTKTNYLIGNDPQKWRTGISNYSKVRVEGVYRGIDLVYRGNQRQVEYDFVVAPRANPKQIRLAFDGVESMRIGNDGELILETASGNLVQPRPVVYQEHDGKRRMIEGRYKLLANHEVGFTLGRYDRGRTLVIDPVILYSTFFGGPGRDSSDDIALDSAGNLYVTGLAAATSLPGPSGDVTRPSTGGSEDAFVTKINAAGTAIVYTTFLGGSGFDHGVDVDVEGSGNAYVGGTTTSTNFAGITGGSLQSTNAGNTDVFLVKLNAAGNSILYATYLGAANQDGLADIETDASGNTYLSGTTSSHFFPGTSGSAIQTYHAGNGDVFLTKINAAGSAIVYSTYLGDSGMEYANNLAIDASGNAYLIGTTSSASAFPGVTSGSLQSYHAGGTYDVFVTKINAAGDAVVWSTYLGGDQFDVGAAIALDSVGNIVVAGDTQSYTFPGVTSNSLQPIKSNWSDAFITKITNDGSAILWSTYLGSTDTDYPAAGGIGLDAGDNVYIAGVTFSTTFPGVTSSSLQPSNAGFVESFVARINSTATAIDWATFLGGTEIDNIGSMEVDAAGSVYVSGITTNSSFPGVDESSIQPVHGAGDPEEWGEYYDSFITKIGEEAGPPHIYSISPSSGYPGTQVTISGANFGATQGTGSVWLGSKLAGSIVSWTNTTIVAIVDAGAASGSAIVQQGGTWSNSIAFTIITPTIDFISPDSGVPGTEVTIYGTNFGATQGTGSVWLGSKLAGSIVSWSEYEIVATVDAGATSGNAIVQQHGVWGNSIPFTVITPNITSINPTSGVAGTQVTFTGTDFGATQGSGSVWLGNKLAGSIVSWSDTQVVATVASGAATGTAQIQQNGVWSNSIAFTVTSPSLTSINPTSGVPGTQVTFTGTNFGATQGTGSVWLGSKLAGSIVSWSNTQIVATVASGAASGSAQVQQNGVWSNSIAFTVTTPSLNSVSPTTARAGDSITLTGTNFGATQGTGSVWLGNKLAGSIVSWSNTQIVAVVASGAKSGSAQVQQSGVWSNAITFTVITPVVSSLSPTSGPVGTQVTITGTGFGTTQGSGLVWLGTKYASVVSWSDTQVVATVASGSATGGTQIYQNGVWSNAVTFTVTP